MSYKLIKDVREVLYWEFRPGEYPGKYKNDFFDNTIYFNSDAMAIIDDCIQRAKIIFLMTRAIAVITIITKKEYD